MKIEKTLSNIIDKNSIQISNNVFCSKFLFELDLETRLIPNSYYDYPFLIIDDFLSKEEYLLINNDLINSFDYEKAKLKTLDTYPSRELNENIRKTNIYKLKKSHLEIYNKKFKQHQARIEDYFKLCLTSFSKLQVLEYLKDSFYSMHSDDSSMIYENKKLIAFKPVARNRKLSSVLFTTSYSEEIHDNMSFKAGELVFNFLFDKNGNNITIKPKAGQMIIFPSNPIFCHEVKKVEDGRRISLVQWHDAILN